MIFSIAMFYHLDDPFFNSIKSYDSSLNYNDIAENAEVFNNLTDKELFFLTMSAYEDKVRFQNVLNDMYGTDNIEDIKKAWREINKVPCLLERKVDFFSFLSKIVFLNQKCFSTIKMLFDSFSISSSFKTPDSDSHSTGFVR